MAGKILEESLAINNVGLNGYIRVISAEGYSYRMLVQTFVELCSSAETIQDAVNNWINEHPEAVTTVEDGSITEVKLSADLQETLHTLIAAVGGPNAAATVAEMTDHSKVYVYTGSESGYTAGNWYYFSNGVWVSGGVYNSTALETDTTLSVAGMAADAKETGDQITELKNDLNNAVALISTKEKGIVDITTWSKTRVNTDGSLTASPSQLTSDKILYIGKGNVIRVETNANRAISVSYYERNTDGSYTYIQSDVTALRYLKYINVKYDWCRISLVGTSADPPLITAFTIDVIQVVNHEFSGKNISFMGDSITTFSGVSEDGYNAPYYPTGDVAYLEQTYEKMFYDACNAGNLSVSAISNSSWRNQRNESCPSAYEDVRITRLSVNGVPDYVFINMGTNDPYSSNIGSEIGYTYDVETLETNVVYSSYAIQTTIRKIQVAYPNAKIILLIPKFPSAIGTGNYTFEKWEKLCDFMVRIAEMYGVYKIVDLRKCGISVETFSADCIGGGMHPNFTGMKKMGAYLINELLVI